MSWSDWVLLNGVWLGLKAGFDLLRPRSRWAGRVGWAAVAVGMALWWKMWVPGLYPGTFWVAGILLLAAALHWSLYPLGDEWSLQLDTAAAGLALLLSGHWLALAAGCSAGLCLAVALGLRWIRQFRRVILPLEPLLLGEAAMACLFAGWQGRFPAHHVSWLWLIPFLLITEFRILSRDGAAISKPARRRPEPRQSGRRDGFGM